MRNRHRLRAFLTTAAIALGAVFGLSDQARAGYNVDVDGLRGRVFQIDQFLLGFPVGEQMCVLHLQTAHSVDVTVRVYPHVNVTSGDVCDVAVPPPGTPLNLFPVATVYANYENFWCVGDTCQLAEEGQEVIEAVHVDYTTPASKKPTKEGE